VADRMAKDCLILPCATADFEAIGKLAETAVTAGKNQSALPYFQCTKALAEYRQGHFTNAIVWARKSLENPSFGADASRFVEAYSVLAMAQCQQNEAQEARATLAQGTDMAKKLTNLDSSDIGSGWRDWIIAQALIKEGDTLIRDRSSQEKVHPSK